MSSYGTVPQNDDPEYGTAAYDTEAQDLGSGDPRANNFPPWMCADKCKCFHHDIKGEIRDKNMRTIVYRQYIMWYCSIIAYVTNAVATGARIYVKFDHATRDFVVAFCVLMLVFPFTLMIYLTLYGATRNVGKTWTWWWLFGAAQILMEIFFAIGVAGTGCAGMGTMIQGFKSHHKTVGFASFASFLAWTTAALFHLVHYIMLWRYRSAVEGGYAPQDNESQGVVKGEKKKKKSKKTKDAGPGPDSYVPPPMVESQESDDYRSSSNTAGNPYPEWHQEVGSAYDTSSSSKPKGSHAPITSDAGNPFGETGGLDNFYD